MRGVSPPRTTTGPPKGTPSDRPLGGALLDLGLQQEPAAVVRGLSHEWVTRGQGRLVEEDVVAAGAAAEHRRLARLDRQVLTLLDRRLHLGGLDLVGLGV